MHGTTGFNRDSMKRHEAYTKPLQRARIRHALRRGFGILVAVACMAVAAYGLVWLLDAMRLYSPNSYEPRDIERYLYQRDRELPAKTKP